MALTKVIGDGIGAVTGNVGIGEAAPANLLHVKVSDTGIAPHASAQIVLEREGTNYLQFLTAENGTSGCLFGDGSDIDVASIKYDHNLKQMQFITETNTAMVIDGNGIITKPLQPAFMAIPASIQTNLATGSYTTIAFGTEIFDLNSDFASNTFTAPVTGKYQFNVHIVLLNVDSAHTLMEMRLNASNRDVQISTSPDHDLVNDSGAQAYSLVTLMDMDASDTAFFEIAMTGGTAQTDVHTQSVFSGYLVC